MIKKLLFLSMLLATNVVAWAQTFTSTTDGTKIDVVLSGNWLDGDDAESKTTELIDLVMGYKDGAFDEAKAYTDVTIKSAEGTVTVNQSLLQQLVSGKAGAEFGNGYAGNQNKVQYLDLRDIAVTHYVGHGGASIETRNPNATFYVGGGGNVPAKFLAMPSFDETVGGQTYSIPPYTIAMMSSLDEVILPANTKTVERCAFAGVNVPTFKLNVGLEFIGNSAFYANSQIDKETTLDVPSTVKYIGPGAFNFRNYSDIYFHSAQAPICPTGKMFADTNGTEGPFLLWGNYTGWGGITGTTGGGDDYSNTGVANRLNYRNGNGYWFTMLHFPASADVPNLDISSYKDDTRVYNKVYGTFDTNPAWAGYDQNKIEVAIVGHEQEYLEREKNWYFGVVNDFVGKESEVMTFDGATTFLAPTDKDQIPVEARGKGAVTTGFEDTYRGLNYIWPSDGQYNRAYATVANGVNWDGVTKYRPELTQEQYELMVKDGLTVKLNGNWVTVGQDITYDEAKANEYNAGLEGAVHAGEAKAWYTADEALAWNSDPETNPNCVAEGDSKGEYTAEEAIAHNESLPTAIHEGGVKEQWTAEDAAANNEGLDGAWHENDPIYPTAQEVLDHNADFDGAKHAGEEEPGQDAVFMTWEEYCQTEQMRALEENGYDWYGKKHTEQDYNEMLNTYKANTSQPSWQWNGWPVDPLVSPAVPGFTYTAEQAAAYNAANHPNPWTESTVIGNVTAEQAIAHNATLPNAVKEGDTKTTYTAEEALAWNSNPETNPNCVAEGDSKGAYTADEAIAYNESLPTAIHEGDEKDWWSAEDAIAENKKLPGAREVGYTVNNLDDPALEDYLRMIAFQSTRRIVFSDNAGGGDNYDIKIPKDEAKEWWTICLPFNLTKTQIDTYFGKGTHVCLFNKVERTIKTEEQIAAGEKSSVKFYFTDDQYPKAVKEDDIVLWAHRAYMIFPTLQDYDAKYIAEGIPMSEYTKVPGSPTPTVVVASDGQEYRFIGNYDTKLPVVNPETGEVITADVVVPQYSYIYAKKAGATGKHPYQFWFTQSSKIKWGANKCIIQSTGADRGNIDNSTFFQETENPAKQVTVFFGDDEEFENTEATDIDVIIVAGNGEDSEVIYNLNGQQLNSAPQNGVFIKNGKKYISK